MDTREDITEAILAALTYDETVAEVLETEDGDWSIRYASVEILAELNPDNTRLVLTSLVGPFVHDDKGALCEMMLCVNAHWRTTGGLRLAVTAPGGDVILLIDLPASGLSSSVLAAVLTNLNEQTLTWRALLAARDHPLPIPDDDLRWPALIRA